MTVRRIPQIFGGNTLYATCAGASLVVVLFSYLGHAPTGMLVATGVGAVLCLLARWRGWQLWQGSGWEYAIRRPPGKRWPRIKVQLNGRAAPVPDQSEEN